MIHHSVQQIIKYSTFHLTAVKPINNIGQCMPEGYLLNDGYL